MKLSVLPSVSVAVLAVFSAACSSSDGGSELGGGADGAGTMMGSMGSEESSGPECDPEGDIPCIEDIGEPCRDLNSGFEGDEYCLAEPDPSIGYQIHVGPDDYTDPDQTDPYMIYPGEETNWAEVTDTPNDETVYTDGYVSHMRPGSHHFILYGLPDDAVPEERRQMNSDGAESAVGAVGGTFIGGATRSVQNALQISDHPDDQGLASETRPHRPVAVNLHFINTTDEPLLQEIWVNYRQIPEDEVRLWSKPITWYGGLGMNIPPYAEETLGNTSPCTPPAEIRVSGVTGHVHANTVRYGASYIREGSTEEEILFEDYDWAEPTEFRFNHTTENPEPDPVNKIPGSHSGVFRTGPGDQFFWECEVHNQTDQNLTFANEVYTGEMCMVFGFYATDQKDAGPWFCAF